MSSLNGFNAHLRKANVSYIPGLYQIGDCSNRVLDRNRRVETRRTVDIDMIHTKPGETVCYEVFDSRRPCVYPKPFAARSPQCSELYRQYGLGAPSVNRAANQHFVVAGAIEVAGVDQVDAVVEGR